MKKKAIERKGAKRMEFYQLKMLSHDRKITILLTKITSYFIVSPPKIQCDNNSFLKKSILYVILLLFFALILILYSRQNEYSVA